MEKVEKKAALRVNAAALAIVRDLTVHTPVDTTRALSNWIVSIGQRDPSYIDPWVPGFAGSTKAASAAEVMALARLILKSRKPGQPIYISNNAPYIRRLNEGYSKQEPAGFVERAVIVGRRELKRGLK